MTDLLELVDELTLPKNERVALDRVDGEWRTAWVSHDPLIIQLRDAASPGANDGTGSGSLKSTRSLIDADALEEYTTIRRTITRWCNAWDVTRTREPEIDLRAWYVATLTRTDTETERFTTILNAWVHQIRRRLHPPQGFTLAFPCPVCGKREWSDGKPDGDGGTFPLRIEYYNTDGTMNRERAVCRNPECGTLWLGRAAVIELAEELTDVPFDTIMSILAAPPIDTRTEIPA